MPVIFNILLGISLQSMGKPQLYMVGNLLSVVLNIILGLIFICVFDMGIIGAALASEISAGFSLMIFNWILITKVVK